VGVIVTILVFGFLAFGFYQRVFGWWNRNRTFRATQESPPSVDAFIRGADGAERDQAARDERHGRWPTP
jgi:hypothetical protein